MRWPLPRSLFGQTVTVLLAGLVVSHLVGAWIYAADRAETVRAIGGFAATQRIANLARLIDEAPADWRSRIVAAASDPALRVSLSPQPPALDAAAAQAGSVDRIMQDLLRQQLPAALAASVQVSLSLTASMPVGPGRVPAGMMGGPLGAGPGVHGPMMAGPWLHASGGWQRLQVVIRLTDGSWLAFTTGLPQGGAASSWRFLIAMSVMAMIVLLVSIWAVRRVTAPLGTVVGAAERLGRDVNAPPIIELGTREMRQVAHAFNDMQGRLQRLLNNRTRMLAALSHDLRTPLTRLRLRAEGVPNLEERDRMLATIGELDAMIEATLRFARGEAPEALRRTDIAALLGAVVDDMADAGHGVSMRPAEPVILECHPTALRRAISNLLDNAVKYGGTARAAIESTPTSVRIIVDDDGPGIPEAEIQRVFEPFYRLEESRNCDTGGSGLGLAIAQSIVQEQGGEVTLANRTQGGLHAVLSLPR
ncbi:ATP-binding protein [Sediminicoccus sp. KRV36]|uniref:ATP-binding protein n=1 Tax=Sediminicoccus sp. KRV36 TaxID=3133721 RepID=UPI0020102D42|nr:ATP-binding protein [Sediminicoccus rosea]UPY35613.1 HAMP domain-containing protein [Sediminicoccus rosea]